MPVLVGYTTPGVTIPYVTVADYRASSESLDTSQLTPGDTPQANDQSLANLIWQASSQANLFCNQDLAATVNVESGRVTCNRRGEINVVTNSWPILELRDFEVGPTPNMLTALADLSGVMIGDKMFTVTSGWGSASRVGPLQFGTGFGYGSGRLFARFTYVNGWPTTTLAASCAAAATSIQVADATGIYGGALGILASISAPPATILTVYDGQYTENLSVAAVTGAGPYTLTLNTPTRFAHTVPNPLTPSTPAPMVSSLPPAVRRAVINLTTALVKERGSDALVLRDVSSPEREGKTGHDVTEDLDVAFELLADFRAVT